MTTDYFTGHPGAIYFLPSPTPVRVPYPPFFVPHSVSSGASTPPSPALALRESILKQIEYYFRWSHQDKSSICVGCLNVYLNRCNYSLIVVLFASSLVLYSYSCNLVGQE